MAHLGYVGRHFGLLGHDDAIDIAYAVAVVVEQLVAVAEQQFAVYALVARVGVREVLADVAKGGGTKEGVADGVEQHVGVGVAEEPQGVGYLDSAEPQFAVGDKLVNVVA